MRCDDLRAGARGPRFAGQAAELGVLSLYAADPAAFGSDSESTGVLLASHAALAIAAARTEAGLLAALDSREMIGQAKGTLMERCKITGCRRSGCWSTRPRP